MGNWTSTYPLMGVGDKIPFNTLYNCPHFKSIVGRLSNTHTLSGLAGGTLRYQFSFYDSFPNQIALTRMYLFTPDPVPVRIPVLGPVFAYDLEVCDSNGNFVSVSTLDSSQLFGSAVDTPRLYTGGHSINDAVDNPTNSSNSTDQGMLLGVNSVSIAAGATVRWYLPEYHGIATLRLSTGSAGTATLRWTPPLGNIIYMNDFDVTKGFQSQIYFPVSQGTFEIKNTGTSTALYGATIIAENIT